jgi:hypothetical protein
MDTRSLMAADARKFRAAAVEFQCSATVTSTVHTLEYGSTRLAAGAWERTKQRQTHARAN